MTVEVHMGLGSRSLKKTPRYCQKFCKITRHSEFQTVSSGTRAMAHCSTASGWDNIMTFHRSCLISMGDYPPNEEFEKRCQLGFHSAFTSHRDKLAVPNRNKKFQRWPWLTKYSSEVIVIPNTFKLFVVWFVRFLLVNCPPNIWDPNPLRYITHFISGHCPSCRDAKKKVIFEGKEY